MTSTATTWLDASVGYRYLAFADGRKTSVGLLHSDQDGRYSLAYDSLELLRPEIDGAILAWVASQRWSRADFPVTRTGVVRLQPALARVAVERTAAAVPFTRVEQAAEWLRQVISNQAP